MIKLKHWHQSPDQAVFMAMKQLNWHKTGEKSPAANTAALMLYMALLFMADEEVSEEGVERWVSDASYGDLIHTTGGMSRSLVNQGLQRLQDLNMIKPEGSQQRRRYHILELGNGSHWHKLPCQAVVAWGVIVPFRHFTLRSKHELHAMKLYFYLAAVRHRSQAYSVATYETIWQRMDIPERDIPRAVSHLLNCGLLARVSRETDDENRYGPNRYYLAGYGRLFSGSSSNPMTPAPVTEISL